MIGYQEAEFDVGANSQIRIAEKLTGLVLDSAISCWILHHFLLPQNMWNILLLHEYSVLLLEAYTIPYNEMQNYHQCMHVYYYQRYHLISSLFEITLLFFWDSPYAGYKSGTPLYPALTIVTFINVPRSLAHYKLVPLPMCS